MCRFLATLDLMIGILSYATLLATNPSFESCFQLVWNVVWLHVEFYMYQLLTRATQNEIQPELRNKWMVIRGCMTLLVYFQRLAGIYVGYESVWPDYIMSAVNIYRVVTLSYVSTL